MTRHCDKHDKHDKHKCRHRCCYDYKKLNVKHLKTCDLKVKKDAIIGEDLTVKGDLCVEGNIIEKRDNFNGWWRTVTKGDKFQAMKVDTVDENNPIVTIYDGVCLSDLFEYPNGGDPLNLEIINNNTFIIPSDTSVTQTVDGICLLYTSPSPRDRS